MSSRAEREYFEEKGLPYHITSMSQLFGAITTAGDHSRAVVAEVGHLIDGTNYYVGYYPMREAAEVAARIKRSRKYHVNRIHTFKIDD